MNEDVKKKWVAALNSGEYKQAPWQLRKGDGFCCLGVLCDLHAKETGGEWVDDTYLGSLATLPSAVKHWAGLNQKNPTVTLAAFETPLDSDMVLATAKLSELNDKGVPFDVIAELIDQQL